MGVVAHDFPAVESVMDNRERRAAPRVTSLIRAAKLVCGKGEFVCVVRDVSASGAGVRCFHTVPEDASMALELQNGDSFEIAKVRGEGPEASFRFVDTSIEVDRLIRETWTFPRRPLRLAVSIPVTMRTLAGQSEAITKNVSQQGCRVETALPLSLAQSVLLESPHLPGIRAKVRWRRDGECGLVFDDTFSLSDFAIHVAKLQCPQLTMG